MIIATWNCNMAFRRKGVALLKHCPDLVVVPECEHPEKLGLAQAIEPHQVIWTGRNIHKGLGVFSYRSLYIHVHESYDPSIEYVIPIVVTGKETLTLIAVWAMDNKIDHKARYIGRVWQAVERYESLINSNTFIIGDFNWNTIWDRDNQSLYGNLTEIIDKLDRMGIVSFYHYYFAEHFGQETQATLYMHRNVNKRYHVDYIFGSRDYTRRIQSVVVGNHDEWLQYSDHMPMIVEL